MKLYKQMKTQYIYIILFTFMSSYEINRKILLQRFLYENTSAHQPYFLLCSFWRELVTRHLFHIQIQWLLLLFVFLIHYLLGISLWRKINGPFLLKMHHINTYVCYHNFKIFLVNTLKQNWPILGERKTSLVVFLCKR